jgi:heat shock protein HslJ
MAITVRGCPTEAITQQEETYHQLLRNSARYRVSGDQLEIGSTTNPRALVFRRRQTLAMDPQKLIGTRWQLRAVDGRPLLLGSTLTLLFDSGTVSGSTGCRAKRGTY